MLEHSPVMRAFIIVFAMIGALAVLAVLGMAVMHGGMMTMMSEGGMASMCQNMMGSRP